MWIQNFNRFNKFLIINQTYKLLKKQMTLLTCNNNQKCLLKIKIYYQVIKKVIIINIKLYIILKYRIDSIIKIYITFDSTSSRYLDKRTIYLIKFLFKI
jgi:mRNA deadenylase 3'-5' endonuclease subunit Ccr4